MENLIISLCTVCMNRLHHIQKTLPQNIKDNLAYQNVEFILLDYNSTDGLEEWIKDTMQEHIVSGKLKYFRTTQPEFFDRSHSRNLMFKLTKGDILCNIDADNYTGFGFANYVNDVFQQNDNIYLVADTKKRFYFLRNAFGRFCVTKKDFLSVEGLDEKMKSYGSETLDFYERLNLIGKEEVVITNTNFLKTISHGDDERISNEFFLKSLDKFYVKYISPEESEVLILYKNCSFEYFTIIPEKERTYLPAALKEGTLKKGIWAINYANLNITFQENGKTQIYLISEDGNISPEGSIDTYYLMTDPYFLLSAAKNYSFITNTEVLNQNVLSKKNKVNEGLYGIGMVCMNFEKELHV